jgi:hypothetical protein
VPKKPPPNEDQPIFPQTPSTPAKLRYSERRIWWPAIFASNLGLLILWAVGRSATWVWGHKLRALDWAAVFFWRSVTLLGVIWLVYDRVYETDATLSVSASDPKWAFEFPFVITNASHIFAIRNVRWTCQFMRVIWEENGGFQNLQVAYGSTSIIDAGRVLNINCMKGFNVPNKLALKEGIIRIVLEYDADFFGWYSIHRKPFPTTFTWFASASNPQWIKGEFEK